MPGADIELAAEVSKNNDFLTMDKESITNAALDLFRQFPSLSKPADTRLSSVLPELTLVPPVAPVQPQPEARPRPRPALNNPNIEMGNPSNATSDARNSNNYLLVKDQYVLSYNNDKKIANWVSWQLNSDWIGSTGRSGSFAQDDSLPSGFNKADPSEYKNTGYDRGHNVPSGDRTKTHADNQTTFEMTNIAPQTGDNNRGPWEKLESYSRELAKQGKELYIIAGNEGEKGTIGNGVSVPENWWKVVVVLPQKGMGLADVNANTEVIAIQIPNSTGMMNDDWRKFTTSVDEIERQTGYDILSNVPVDVQKVIEAKTHGGGRRSN